MKRTANAQWNGTVKAGGGTLSTQSHVLNETPYSFNSRFGDAPQTNPEELIAAAHAGCFSMALSLFLEQAGSPAETVKTKADLNFDPASLTITAIHLTTTVKAPGLADEAFQKIAAEAKANCPVSKVLRAEITLSASLEA